MDTAKYISTGVAVIVAAIGGGVVGSKITDRTPQQLTVEAGADNWTKTVAAAAQVKAEVADIPCERQRVGTPSGIVLKWACNGAVLSDKDQTEINKKAGADVVGFVLRPRKDGERVVYEPADVRGGALPTLEPVPEPTTEKPAEEKIP